MHKGEKCSRGAPWSISGNTMQQGRNGAAGKGNAAGHHKTLGERREGK